MSDNSNAAWTSPVEGSRYRIDYSPTFGTFDYQTVSADWRHYAFFRPFTLAVRAYHLGRYGRDSDSPSLFPLFVGDESLIRGYGYGSFTSPECTTQVANATSCPVVGPDVRLPHCLNQRRVPHPAPRLAGVRAAYVTAVPGGGCAVLRRRDCMDG